MSKKLAKKTAELERAAAEAQLLYQIISVINDADDIDRAVGATLREVCEAIGWDYGEIWFPHQSKAYLEVSAAWYTSNEQTEVFRKKSEAMKFMPGVGLPGRAWTMKAPVWVRDVTHDTNFPRWPEALAAGIKTGMALPLLAVHDEVVAVLNLFTTKNLEEDAQVVKLVSAVAAQLALLIRCRKAEDAFTQSEKNFEWLFKNSTDAMLIFEPKFQIVLDVNQSACDMYGIQRSDFIGLSVETISRNISHDRALIKKALEKGQLLHSEMAHSHKSGTELLLQTDISVIIYQGKQAMLVINRDRRKSSEANGIRRRNF